MDRSFDEATSWRLMFPVLAGVFASLAVLKIAANHNDGSDVLYLLAAAAFVVLRGIGARLSSRFHEVAGACVLSALGIGVAVLGSSAAEHAAPLVCFVLALTIIDAAWVYSIPLVALLCGSLWLGATDGWQWLSLGVASALPLMIVRIADDRSRNAEIEQVRAEVDNQTATMHERSQKLTAARDQAVIQMRAKTAFLAHMSHEIRTPLNGMIGTLTLLERTRLDPTQDAYLRQVSRSSLDLLAIVNDVLDLSKLEAGALELEATSYSIADVLESVVEVHGPVALRKGVDLRLALDAQAFDTVRGDPLRLRHIIANLASNAVKFTDEGEVVVFAETLLRGTDGYRVRLGVRDTGRGIADVDVERVTQPFTQADVSTTREHGGTGLGLSIAQRLLALMDAELIVDTELGVGSTFAFELDVPRAERSELGSFGTPLAGVAVALQCSGAPSPARVMLGALGAVLVETAAEADVVICDDDGGEAPDEPASVLVTTDPESHTASAARGFDGLLVLPWTRRAIVETIAPLLDAEIVPSNRPERPVQNGEGAQIRVLLAEDNDTNRMVMDGQLRIIGAACDAVVNGRAALDKWRFDGPYDLILMDLQMPVMDGYEATREIRLAEREAGGLRTPIVAVTANALPGDDKHALGVGFDEYVTKPFTLDLLREVVEHWGSQRSPMASPSSPSALRQVLAVPKEKRQP